jgi:hypothetical protein
MRSLDTLYAIDYGGYLHAYDVSSGENLWNFFTGSSGQDTPYGAYPLNIPACIADGKVYVTAGHAYNPPLFKGAKIYCVNATDGTLVWDALGFYTYCAIALADGYLVVFNNYDAQVYCYGRGPSATTVTADPVVSGLGSSVMIRGTVTDQSAGSKGTPAIADEYMSEWMAYLHMQQPCPTYVEGVKVKLYAIDPNGNYQDIGYATADSAGNFGKSWVPPVPGEYQIVAEFAGSASYGRSYDTTYFTVDGAPSPSAAIEPEQPATSASTQLELVAPEPTTPEPTASEAVEAPIISTDIAIIAVVAVACIIGIAAFWILRKQK